MVAYEVGEEVTDEVIFAEKFGRRAILNLRQTLDIEDFRTRR